MIFTFGKRLWKSKKSNDTKAAKLWGKHGTNLWHLRAFVRKASLAELVRWCYDLYEWSQEVGIAIRFAMEASFMQDMILDDFTEEGNLRGYQLPITGDTRKKPDKFQRIEAISPLWERDLPSAADNRLSQIRQELSRLFEGMMKTLYKEQGSQFRIELLETPKMQEFINAHADALNSGFQQVKMSDSMRQRLQRSNYIFSGMKTFHELNEAFPSLINENGERKPFEQFLNDVQKIDRTYNQNYLRAEYNFCQASAAMAAKWEEFQQDGDRYNLQYRTAGDDRVRPEHAALDRVTLPMSDPFWQEYYPPNGWNCRCTVVQVRKSKYPVTPHDEAMALGEEATGKDTKGIFHFNPGIEQKTFPDYNPYTIKRCRDCDIAKALAPDGSPVGNKLVFVPENELCAACRIVRALANADAKQTRKYAKPLQGTAINTSKFPHPINISRASITEWTNQPNKYQQEKNKMLLRIKEVFEDKECKYLGPADPPPGKEKDRVLQHHIFSTKVKGEEQCIIVWEWDWGEYTLHSISDNPDKIKKHIKKK